MMSLCIIRNSFSCFFVLKSFLNFKETVTLFVTVPEEAGVGIFVIEENVLAFGSMLSVAVSKVFEF